MKVLGSDPSTAKKRKKSEGRRGGEEEKQEEERRDKAEPACPPHGAQLGPLAAVADEARGTLLHALPVMDDEALGVTALSIGDVGAEVSVHTAPALEAVGAGWTGGHADASIVEVSAGHTGRVVVGCMAAAQALRMAALLVLGARTLPAGTWAHCGQKGSG